MAVLVVLGCLATAPVPPAAAAVTATPVVQNADFPSAFTIAADGRVFFTEKNTGRIRYWKEGAGKTTFATVADLCTTGEQGLLGIALAPSGPDVFVYAVRMVNGACREQVLRVAPGSTNPTVIFEEAGATPNHVGGRLALGPDGNLWLSIGDGQDPANSQNTGSPKGKILRMTTTGTAAAGNPIAGNRMFAYGVRNVFGFAFDAVNDNELWATENGPACNDEIDHIEPGHNYGWGPSQTCTTGTAPQNTNADGPSPHLPEHWWADANGPTGAAFCAGCGLGADLEGRLLYGSVGTGQIRALTLDASRTAAAGDALAYTHTGGVLAVERGPDGRLWFSDSTTIYRLGGGDTGGGGGTPAISVGDTSASESAAQLVFTVSLSSPSAQDVSVKYVTKSGTAGSGDFTAVEGRLTIPAGATARTVAVRIKPDTTNESDETLTLLLKRPRKATIADGTGIGTILDDD